MLNILLWRHYIFEVVLRQIEIQKFADKTGAYKRQALNFRNWILREAGAEFPPETNRYHLYVSYACPWAHRTLIGRSLKGLELHISVSVVHWHMDNKGWRFPNELDLAKRKTAQDMTYGTVDHLYGFERLLQLYYKADPNYSGRFTVPVLWDKKKETIVNNESSEILRMLNSEFNDVVASEYSHVDLYPEDLKQQIDDINSWVYDTINNGVYKAGFSIKQEIYEDEVNQLFKSLHRIESILKENHGKGHKFLLGNQLTEADVRLFTTIVRFDAVYHQHFKCNLGMIRHDFPFTHDWLRLLYWKIPGFSETTDFDHIKWHYTKSHPAINPHGITPVGPVPSIMPL
ncbi:hypothetical protein QFC19_003150 [Naganishia cerealis]|uniref:Uncharacterized protein n=1 Tax=Naganishia cerealis TaxID=610337 RepID=A0ACC2W6G3_9TREE|nr:hypothetical protein QFC19_003150 [Naganishia cerealis]